MTAPLFSRRPVAENLQNMDAQGRGQIGRSASLVDFRDQRRDREAALPRQFAQGVPERSFERNAGAMSGDHQLMFAHPAGFVA